MYTDKMDNPYAPQPRKRNESPPAYNSFQRELENKMRQRKKQGLTADVTPSESGQESADELGSDNELMAGFNMTSKNRSRSPSPRKSPFDEMNGMRSYDKKKEMIFGKKSPLLSDDDDDDGYGENDLLKTKKRPMDLQSFMTKGGNKKLPTSKQSKPNKYGSFREEDEVDAAPSNMSKYDRHSPFNSYDTNTKKTWEPPSYRKSPLIEPEDDEQLKLDLNKTKHRPKSPKPGRKTPSDLDSITEEKEMNMEEPFTRKGALRKNEDRPTPKPRSGSYAEVKSKPRPKSPATDIFGTSKNRSKSPFADERDDRYKKDKDRKSPDSKKTSSILDHLAGSPRDKKSYGKKEEKGKEKKGKSKYLTHDDSDDSIGDEFGRRDSVARKSKYDQGSPLDRYNNDKHSKSPYDLDRKSPYDKDRLSPFDSRGRGSPFDPLNRKSPFDDRLGDERRASPLSVGEDRKKKKSSSPNIDRTFSESLYAHQRDKEKSLKDKDSKSRDNSKERNPFSTKDRYNHDDDHYNRKDERSKRNDNPFDRRDDDHDDRYGDRDRRHDRYDDRRDDRYGDRREDRYGDRRDDRSGDRKDDRYGDRRDDRYGDRRDDRYGDRKDDRYGNRDKYGDKDKRDGRKSPFGSQRRDYEDDRKSPFGGRKSPFDKKSAFSSKRDDYDHLDNKKQVGFEYDRPPTLKGGRDPNDRGSGIFDEYDRSSRNRRDDDDYDRYRRRSVKEDEDFDDRHSRSKRRGSKKGDDRESSVCRDVEADPSVMRRPDTEEEVKIKKRQVKAHTKQTALLDQIIDSVKDEQHKFRPVDPDQDKEEKKDDKKRSMSARHRPKPRYAKPMVESFPTARPSSAIDPNNTTSIREAVFIEWYKERNEKAKKQKEEKLKEEKKEEERKKKEEEDKKMESIASYNAWMEKKQDELIDKERKKRREENKKYKEEDNKEQKRREADMTFRKWKEDKDVVISEKVRRERRLEERKKQEEEEAKLSKKKDAKSAYRGWNEKKEEVLKEEAYNKQREIAKQKREEKRKQAEREKEASKSYQKWMDKKGKDTDIDKTKKNRTLQEYSEPRPAWSPASRTIPFGR